jgi:hypothetical protein
MERFQSLFEDDQAQSHFRVSELEIKTSPVTSGDNHVSFAGKAPRIPCQTEIELNRLATIQLTLKSELRL